MRNKREYEKRQRETSICLYVFFSSVSLSVNNECKCQILSLIYPYTSPALPPVYFSAFTLVVNTHSNLPYFKKTYRHIDISLWRFSYWRLYRTRTQTHGNGFCSSVGIALVLRSRVPGSTPSRRPWSCIFRNWSRLGFKMYYLSDNRIYLALKIYLLTTSVNAKYYL